MGMFLKKSLHGVLILGLFLGFSVLHAYAVPVLRIAPPKKTVQPNEHFSLDIAIADVTDLLSFQFDLAFDPSVLSATSITEGPFLPSGGSTFFVPGTIDNTAGTLTFTADTLIGVIAGVAGSDILATASFQALALGTSPIMLSNVIVLDSTLADIATSTGDGTVHVVPEPGTFVLLAPGLLGLLGYGLRKWQET
jgi:general secretion pathway protein D